VFQEGRMAILGFHNQNEYPAPKKFQSKTKKKSDPIMLMHFNPKHILARISDCPSLILPTFFF
jgi:hypothetical protein